MIWEINKLFQIIDKKKWNKLTIKQQQQFIIQIKIWFAINYIIHLHLSKRTLAQQLKLLISYYHNEPNMFMPLHEKDIVELFFRIQPIIPVLLYINYIGVNKFSKTRSKKKSSKSHKSLKSHKSSKSHNMKGGYLFMLTSRGEKPIRGVDMEAFLSKMDNAVDTVSYLPSVTPSPDVPSDPYNGFALLYFLSRNNLSNATSYVMPYIGDYINIFSASKSGYLQGAYKYSSLLSAWKNLQDEASKVKKKESANEEFMKNYESFIKKYIGKQEFREKKNDYKQYLNNVNKYKQRNEIEKKLFEHYNKANKDPPPKSVLDHISKMAGLW